MHKAKQSKQPFIQSTKLLKKITRYNANKRLLLLLRHIHESHKHTHTHTRTHVWHTRALDSFNWSIADGNETLVFWFHLSFLFSYRFMLICSRFHWATTASDTILPVSGSVSANRRLYSAKSIFIWNWFILCAYESDDGAAATAARCWWLYYWTEIRRATTENETLYFRSQKIEICVPHSPILINIVCSVLDLFKAAAIWIFWGFCFLFLFFGCEMPIWM